MRIKTKVFKAPILAHRGYLVYDYYYYCCYCCSLALLTAGRNKQQYL